MKKQRKNLLNNKLQGGNYLPNISFLIVSYLK
jgi:hypothetical protein